MSGELIFAAIKEIKEFKLHFVNFGLDLSRIEPIIS